MDTKDLVQAKRDMEQRISDYIRGQAEEFAERSGISISAVKVSIVPLPRIRYEFINDPHAMSIPFGPHADSVIAEVDLAI